MHLGFTTREAGLSQKKYAVNIIFKNVWIVCTGKLLNALWVVSIVAVDKLRVDDAVGAISIHAVGSTWGTLAVGIFSFYPGHRPMTQLIGTLSIGAFAFLFALITFGILKLTVGVRLSKKKRR